MRSAPRRLFVAAVAALAVTAGAAALPALAASDDDARTGGSPSRGTVTGIDVASWQHPGGAPIDWDAVADESGHDFAIIKATESTDYVNPYFVDDRAGAQAAGLVVGTYHFATPELPVAASATAQADHFVDTIGTQRLSRTLPPVLDLEKTGDLSADELVDWAETWLVRVQERTGRTPMLYSFDQFLRTRIADVDRLAGFPLWVAAYQDTAPEAPGAWERWRIWQETSSGSVPGIEGRVDLNVFDGGMDALLRFATGEVPARISDRRAQSGEPVTISGRVDASYAGETIRLTKRIAGRWQRVGSAQVSDAGRYEFEIAPRAVRTHVYVVRLDSESPYARVRSESLSVTVEQASVSAAVETEVVPVGLGTTVTGRTDRYYAGAEVRLLDATPSGFVTSSTARVRANGSYEFAVPAERVGPHLLRVALVPGDRTIATSDLLLLEIVGP